MTQCVKCLPRKREDLGSNPQNSSNAWWCTLILPVAIQHSLLGELRAVPKSKEGMTSKDEGKVELRKALPEVVLEEK